MEHQRDEQGASDRDSQTRTRLVIYGMLLIVMAAVAWYLLDQRSVAAEHERITEQLMATGEYAQAARELEPLMMDRAGFLIRDQIEHTLAQAYLGAGDDPGVSLIEAARWYRKAEEIDPELIDERRRQAIHAGESQAAAQD